MSEPEPPLRVARIVTRLNVGGPTDQVIALTHFLSRPPGSAILLAGPVGKDEGDRTVAARVLGDAFTLVDGLSRGLAPWRIAAASATLRRAIAAFRPHVVHTHESRAGLLGRRAARAQRVPVVVHTHHGHVLRRYFGPVRSAALALMERRLARLSDALVVPAPEIAEELASLGVAPREKFVVVQPGLDVLPWLSAALPSRSDARARLGLDPGRPVVAFAGRLVPIKDPLLFVEAARRIAEAVPSAQFAVAGDGPLREAMVGAAERAAPGRFVFLGFLDGTSTLARAADVLLVTSRHEGLPAALVEAMACGAAVVATRVGGIPGIVRDGVSGRLAESGDAAGLSGAAIDLLRDASRRDSLAAAARDTVRAREFSPERMARELRSLYERLLAEKGIEPRGSAAT